MDKVLILADSRKYIRNNCFQLQLHKSIKVHNKDFQVEYFYLNPKELQNFQIFKQKSLTPPPPPPPNIARAGAGAALRGAAEARRGDGLCDFVFFKERNDEFFHVVVAGG